MRAMMEMSIMYSEPFDTYSTLCVCQTYLLLGFYRGGGIGMAILYSKAVSRITQELM